MANTAMLKAKGLNTFSSYLSAVPEGALLDAKNVVIDRDGVIEPRRGFKQYGTITNYSKQLALYKDRTLVHFDDILSFDNGSGTYTPFSDTFEEVSTGLRVKYIELNGNFYVTTVAGIKKISTDSAANLGTAEISLAGVPRAIDLSATIDFNSTAGFLDPYTTVTSTCEVSYRVVWGRRDLNNNLLLGAASYKAIVQNFTNSTRNVILTFSVPDEIQTSSLQYFYQVYRTSNAVLDGSGDEMKLVYEDVYVSGDEVTVFDEQPAELRDTGTPLYSNEFSGEGILQSNDRPPVAKDIAAYKSAAFYANTRTAYQNELTLLGLDGLGSLSVVSHTGANPATITTSTNHGLTSGDKVVVVGAWDGLSVSNADGVYTVTVTGPTTFTVNSAAKTSTDVITIFTSSVTVTQGMTTNSYYFVGRPEISSLTVTTATGLAGDYFNIAAYDDTIKYTVWFYDTVAPAGTDPNISGRVSIKVDYQDGVDTTTTLAEKILDALESTGEFNVSQLTNVLTITTSNNGVAEDISAGTSGFTVSVTQQGFGEDDTKNYVRISGLTSPASRIEDTAKSFVSIINRNTADVILGFYNADASALPGSMNFQAESISTTTYTFIANNAGTGGMFNPDLTTAQTATNEVAPNRLYFSKTGQPEAVPLTNSLDIGPKDKAILRIIGLRDSLFIFKEEGIYRLTGDNFTNFTVTLFDNSSILLAPDTAAVLNNQIYCLTSQGVATVTETGVAIISRPIEDVFTRISSPSYTNFSTASFAISSEADRSYIIWVPKLATDTVASLGYRFNTFTQTWTYWEKEATCGVVSNRIYIGAGDLPLIEQERKNLTRTDYADRQYDLNINNNAVQNKTVTLDSVANVTAGDILVQTQYVTQHQVIKLAKKLALDPSVPDTINNSNKDYYRNFSLIPGCNLQLELAALITQLNSDLSEAFNTVYSTSFSTFQTEFNTLVGVLNASSSLFFTNYDTSVGTVDYELAVLSKNTPINLVTVDQMTPIIVGPVTVFQSIDSLIIWAPSTFGDPSMLKHVRESTMMFETAAISSATLGYNTDLSADFEDIVFGLEGDGSWGSNTYSSATWGGLGTSRPFRTLIPRQKQRCRFIRCRFKHNAAYFKYAILGLSYTYEVNSERAYR